MALLTSFRFARQLTLQLKHFPIVRAICSMPVDTTRFPHPLTRPFATRASFGNVKSHRSLSKSAQPLLRPLSAQTERRLQSDFESESVDARDIYKEAVNSVEPRQMVTKVLQYDADKHTLTVEGRSYGVHSNVFVVGFGKAVLGMGRAVEDILGSHVVRGILSIPRGQRDVFREKGKQDLLLSADSRIEVYEGGTDQTPDQVAHQAALAVEKLLAARKDTDLVIFLMSGGGSALLPCPEEGMSVEDLVAMTTCLYHKGASVSEVNTLRKKVERLKGGKAVDTAHPAKVVSLIISDVVGDPISLIASGPTVHGQVTAHQCFQILQRFDAVPDMPPSIVDHLQRQLSDEESLLRYNKGGAAKGRGVLRGEEAKQRHEEHAQNVLVGCNMIACQAAERRALKLGHLPYLLSTTMKGEARVTGQTLAKLATFMLLCFDRRQAAHLTILQQELDLVKAGISKGQVNDIVRLVDTAAHTGRNAAIVCGGESVVNMTGVGTGGRNLELVVGAAIELQRLFRLSEPRPRPAITVLSADTDGEDGVCSAAGAVVNENFYLEAEAAGVSCEDYLANNDSYSLLKAVRGGRDLVVTRMTGTNVMDIQVVIVRNPLREFMSF